MKALKTLAVSLVLSSGMYGSTVSGVIVDAAGKAVPAGTQVQFKLEGCAAGATPTLQKTTVVVPPSITLQTTAGGNLTGSIIGNDVIICGAISGQTYYQVSVYKGSTLVLQNNYYVSGAIFNLSSASPLSPQTSTLLVPGGLPAGGLLIGNGTQNPTYVPPNTSTTPMVLQSVNGTLTWVTPTSGGSGGIPPLPSGNGNYYLQVVNGTMTWLPYGGTIIKAALWTNLSSSVAWSDLNSETWSQLTSN